MTTTDPFLAKHYWWEPFSYKGIFESNCPGATQLLICFFIYFLYVFFANPLSYCLGLCFPSWFLKNLDINEDIDTYANCLDDDDKDWTV